MAKRNKLDNLKRGDGFDTHPERINRKGRPKKLPQLDILLADILGEEKDGMTAAEVILKKLRQEATKGNLRAIEIILERAYGKSKQQHEVSGIDGGPIAITTIQFVDEQDDTDKE